MFWSSSITKGRNHVKKARYQVANTHSTNPRDDVDRVIESLGRVLDGQEQHTEELTFLRREIAHERVERLAVAERLDNHLADDN
ncbi:DUF2746 domain-containing protein [Streptomyces sp. MspMP-M5]|uniref:DUF2746 domain-containing protein n=1 Tax=unclassified Streptomyces TaxID=2593676 RepID=UPI00037D917F|nr:DUF2746 domain-containing protein [Streptomyces sp. MspMP-M5]MYT31759.1 hypothetical protein [Streptomyces sp. SID8354]